jgi:hypothetical protein
MNRTSWIIWGAFAVILAGTAILLVWQALAGMPPR